MNSATSAFERADKINGKLSSTKITSIICNRKNDLWVGTAGKGVYKVSLADQQCVNYELASDGFGNNQVFCVYEDKKGIVWAGTWGSGIFYFDQPTQKFINATEYDKPNHIPNTAYVTQILEDSSGTMWVATLYGLYELKRKGDNKFTYVMHAPDGHDGSIQGSQVHTIAEDRNRNLWIGTNEGLNVKEKNSADFILYKMQAASGVNTIRSIVPDNFGNIWIGGSIGLTKFDLATKSFVNYTREDGLKSNNFQRNAALASRSGKLFFGSNDGFDSFFPENIPATSWNRPIILTDLRINNQSVKPGTVDSPLKKQIGMTSDLVLSYDQRSFVIDFAVLDPGQPPHYSYCYMLEGFDDEWNCFGPNNSATYTNLNPGHYVFMVKAANRDGAWTEKPLTLDITIKQVVWKTWWAYTIYIGLLAIFGYVLAKVRVERLKMKNEITLEKLKREQEHELSESKNQFFTNIAHEFRTPLSLILLPLETLVGAKEIPQILHQHVLTAFKNADRMKRLVNELLDFNKLEAGNLQLQVQYLELVQFIFETSSSFNEMAQRRQMKFTVTSEVETIFGWLDPDKLERVIFNVLSNAFKFTEDTGEIKVNISTKTSVNQEGNMLRFIVIVIEDNGIGMLPEELPRVFDKFYQAKSSSKVSSPGTGIGLSFSKALVELHRGTISVDSIPDHTTNFAIVIPIDAAAYGIEEPDTTLPGVVPIRESVSISALHDKDEHHEALSDRPKILVAEDNHELRNFLVAELHSEFSVLQARDGEEALAMALEMNPDLIISDIMMPRKDGIEFCRAIKSELSTCHIPFILLTAKATIDDQINGIGTGADLYIPKPFSIRYLTTHIRQIIASRQKMYARFSQDVYLMPGKAATNALDQAFLQKAIDYIILNLKDPQLSVDSIADLFNLSRMQVYRKIKALSGKSVVEFIKMVRMKQAIKLMDAHSHTLSEIAFEVGFNSPSYFTRCFKEEFGKAPSEYLGATNA
jgi:signal transduction histidine kinase/DNA-binding response OmpR family regulator/streptogramin lyase